MPDANSDRPAAKYLVETSSTVGKRYVLFDRRRRVGSVALQFYFTPINSVELIYEKLPHFDSTRKTL